MDSENADLNELRSAKQADLSVSLIWHWHQIGTLTKSQNNRELPSIMSQQSVSSMPEETLYTYWSAGVPHSQETGILNTGGCC